MNGFKKSTSESTTNQLVTTGQRRNSTSRSSSNSRSTSSAKSRRSSASRSKKYNVPENTPQSAMSNDVIIELNVGGIVYSATKETMTRKPDSKLCQWFKNYPETQLPTDKQGRPFVDRDGELFRYILDYLRCKDKINPLNLLPERFGNFHRLVNEAEFYGLKDLQEILGGIRPFHGSHKILQSKTSGADLNAADLSNINFQGGYITIGYQGTFSFGRQGMGADVNFRKINRILVCGRVSLCREIFGESLHEGRDPDRGHGEDRYTARYYLKHAFLEQAFDNLADAGFELISCNASGTSASDNQKPGNMNTEEDRWAHYNEFIFFRRTPET